MQEIDSTSANSIKINEIFYSIQGEGSFSGMPCVFIRLTNCHLRCVWCDTTYSFHEGSHISIQEIIKKVNKYPTNLIEITGGEPLLQKNAYILMQKLLLLNKKILVETSGAVNINQVPAEAHIVLDMKAPGSGESEKNIYENLNLMKKTDDLKIVISDYQDFQWAKNLVSQFNLSDKLLGPVILQPAYEMLPLSKLSSWIKEYPGFYRLGIQLHKVIYSPELRGV